MTSQPFPVELLAGRSVEAVHELDPLVQVRPDRDGNVDARSKRRAKARLTVLLPTAGAPTTRKMGAGFTLGP